MNTKKVKLKDLSLGDYVLAEDRTIGLIFKFGFSFLHNHPFVKIVYFKLNREEYYYKSKVYKCWDMNMVFEHIVLK